MASRNEALGQDTIKQSFSSVQLPSSSQQRSGGSGFAGIEDPAALELLTQAIQQAFAGGPPEEQAKRTKRAAGADEAIDIVRQFSKASAFTDASALAAKYLKDAMEKNQPLINQGLRHAGGSASSFQALMAQKLALEGAQAAAALQPKIATDYAERQINALSALEAFTRSDTSALDSLVRAMDLLKVQRQENFSQENKFSGGTTLVPITETIQKAPSQSSGGGGGTFGGDIGALFNYVNRPDYEEPASYGGTGGYHASF